MGYTEQLLKCWEGSGGQQALFRKLRSQRKAHQDSYVKGTGFTDSMDSRRDANRTLTRLEDREHDKAIDRMIHINTKLAQQPEYRNMRHDMEKEARANSRYNDVDSADRSRIGNEVTRKAVGDAMAQGKLFKGNMSRLYRPIPVPVESPQTKRVQVIGRGGRVKMPVVEASSQSYCKYILDKYVYEGKEPKKPLSWPRIIGTGLTAAALASLTATGKCDPVIKKIIASMNIHDGRGRSLDLKKKDDHSSTH